MSTTGFNRQDQEQELLQNTGTRNHIPNYAGFVPGIKSENLFGKTFGKITQQTTNRDHHKGSNLPADIRYKSEVKDAYSDQGIFKIKDRYLYGKQEFARNSNMNERRYDPKERNSELSYDQAIKQIQ